MDKKLIRSDIQGLRGIAVISVVLFHAWSSLLPGGFVGVDIFFVISGFVITKTILKDFDSGKFTVGEFYRRRILRIFPALYVMILAVTCISLTILSPKNFVELEKTSLTTIFYISNIYFLKISGYFDGASTLKPLLHTWSLSVEEQFYFVYPIILFFINKKYPKLLLWFLLTLAVLSLTLSELMIQKDPSAAFYLAQSRAFELLLGAIVACPLLSPINEKLRNLVSLIGLIMIASALILLNDKISFPGIVALLPCFGTAFIIYSGNCGQTFAGHVMSLRPLVFFGGISYSLYLWHWPALVLARHFIGGELNNFSIVIVLVISVFVAFVSFKYIEQPILHNNFKNAPFLRIGVAIMVLFSLLALPGIITKGYPIRFSSDSHKIFSASDDFNHRRTVCHGDGLNPIPYENNCIFGAVDNTPDVAVWGDSHGAELVVSVGERLLREGRAVLQITTSACPPSLKYELSTRPYCEEHNDQTVEHLVLNKRIKTIILTANFIAYKDYKFSTMTSGFIKAVFKLRDAGKRVIIVAPIPVFDFDPPDVLGARNEYGQSLFEIGLSTQIYHEQNIQVFKMLDSIQIDDQDIVFPESVLCDSILCRPYNKEKGVLYFNKDHLSLTGTRLLVEIMHL